MAEAVELTRWPHQDYARVEVPRLILSGVRRVCLTTPTGGGKSLTACDMIEWGLENEYWPVVYTNRKILVRQLSRVLKRHGIEFGVRAAGHLDRRERQVQVSSLPTEHSRVIRQERWQVHGHGRKVLAIVDEAHLNKSDTAATILGRHIDDGGAYVGLTATPIGLAHLYDQLVVAGTPSELRKCGAIVPAYHTGVDEPDMRTFKQNVKTGEFAEGDVKKAIMTKCVFGRVIEHYRDLNPDRRPTILFAPGVPESIWFAQELTNAGHRAASIDGKGVWIDGEYHEGADREPIFAEVAAGELILCNRFIAREGLDIPAVSHIILATVMGSLQTYLQSCGRGGRAHRGKTRYTLQDHGGHWHRHGSVNADRDWKLTDTEQVLLGTRQERFRQKEDAEPIRCPQCGLIRAGGARCPQCQFQTTTRTRIVVQEDGRLVEHEGDIYKPRKVKQTDQTEALWKACYFACRKGKTFKQARGWFYRKHGYWPPENLAFMPREAADWFLPIRQVPYSRLHMPERKAEPVTQDLFSEQERSCRQSN